MEHVNFYLDPFAPLLAAMIAAEGGPDAFVRAVRCSFPETRTIEEALARACKTIRNRVTAYCDFCAPGGEPLFVLLALDRNDPWTGEPKPRRLRLSDTFIRFLGARWAPIGVANDPNDLNRNWVPNVCSLYLQELRKEE